MTIELKRTNSDDTDFQKLVSLLDSYLRVIDGKDHSFYAQYNKIDAIKYAVVAYVDKHPVGCGAVKKYDGDVAEIKRMFVKDEFRGQGIAQAVLKELEQWAKELGFSACILETGKKQFEAIRLYEKAEYKLIPNYGQYENIENSVCMKKLLSCIKVQ